MTKRILQLIPTFDRAGAEKQMLLLASGLPKADWDVHACALTRGGPIEADLREANIPVDVIGKRWKADPFAYNALRKYIRHLKPDLVHTWIFAAGAYGRAAAKSAGVPVLVHGERCIDKWKSGWQWKIDRHLAKSTDQIVANSNGVKQFCIEHGLPEDKMTYIPNAVEASKPSDVTREELLVELGLPSDARLIGCVSRLWPQKRIKDLIWAYELVVLLHPTAKLLIIGDGPQRDMLERYARLVSLPGRVHFLGARNDVWRIMPHLDVFWNGSEYEGMPNAVMEAMAAALPVVATDIPGNQDLILPETTGYLVPVGSRAGFGKTTDRILSDPAHRERLGQAGQEHVRENFSIATMVERYAKLYTQLLDNA